jgi:hypothetical protein
VSLTPIILAFVLVAVLFNGVALLSVRWLPRNPGAGGRKALLRAIWLPATAEALVLTLLAALWFGSLGHGGWVLVFLLLGVLVGGGDRWLRHRLVGTPAGPELKLLAAGLLKYLLAGGLCAWCLT